MNNQMLITLVIAAIGLILVGLVVWFAIRSWLSRKLRERFGSEYDYTVEKIGDQHAAEEKLLEREKRVSNLEIRTLNETERQRYQEDWTKIQADFVDDPAKSVSEANRLITEVMIMRGFPVADFEQRAADLSVLIPDSVSNYRSANEIAMKNQRGEASTEELRQAMVDYRALFEELTGIVVVQNPEATKEVAIQ